jgi:ubiquinone biosynthesis protein UbiJ
MPAFPNPYTAAIRGLNALLSREPWARDKLRPHAGKTARLIFGAVDTLLVVTESGHVAAVPANAVAADAAAAGAAAVDAPAIAATPAGAVPDVTLTVAPDKLPSLMSGDTAQRMSAVRIDGDAALAHVIGDLARDLRWDVEDDLARVVGDIPAARLVAAASSAARGLRDTTWRLAENVAEYLSEESGAVASRYALENWSAEVRRVRDDTERTAKRIALLQARLNAIAPRVDKE